jgi:hypothetical protein
MTRDQDLHDKLKDYCQDIAGLFIAAIKDGTVPRRLVNKIEMTEQGMSHSYAEEPDWLRLEIQREKEAKALPSYGGAVEAMRANPNVLRHLDQLVGTTDSRMRVDADGLLRTISLEVMQQCSADRGTGDVFERSFEGLYEDVEAYFYSGKVAYRFLAVVEGFAMDVERVELGEGKAIVRIGKEKREKLFAGVYEFGGFAQASPFARMEYGIDVVTEVPKMFGEVRAAGADTSSMVQAREGIAEIVSSLRLFKKGNFGFNSVRMERVGWTPQGGDMVSGGLESKSFFGMGYALAGVEVAQYLEWWEMYRRARGNPRRGIDLALRRFNVGYERARPEDRLIDYFIGFEAILLKEEERQELDYRLAVRGGVLLGKNGAERNQIFNELRAGYRARSKIVHGEVPAATVKSGTEQVPFGEFVDRVEELLRVAIKECLVACRTKTERELLEELDIRIVSGP